MPRQTPLYSAHRKAGARLVDFAGWEMPVQYQGLLAEHHAVRTAAGLFDVSHMGEVEFSGPGALETANRLISNDLVRCADGQAVYAGLLNPKGGFIDDVVAYRFSPQRILVCVNAGNRDKDFAWMTEHARGVRPTQRSDDFAQLALQGPRAQEILAKLTPLPLATLKPYRFSEGSVADVPCIVSRTGYTGEDGFELYCPPDRAERSWNALLDAGGPLGLVPAGLGARDSLRTEMKYALYGNDINDDTTPLEAQLGWIVKLDKSEFIGKDVLAAQKAKGVDRLWVGFELLDAGVPRAGYGVTHEGKPVGTVTSGTMSPSLKRAIGMAYVPPALAAEGTVLNVDIRGRAAAARVVKTPFYKRG